jgi:putative ABC transport system permease protein
MLKNYFKIAFRNLMRHKAFSFINIAGLAIGIASCLLPFTVAKYELSYDTFQPNYNQIYQLVTHNNFENGITYNPGVPVPALEGLKIDFPQITNGSLLASYGSQVTVVESNANTSSDKKFIEATGFFFADSEFFHVFHYNCLAGSSAVVKSLRSEQCV